MSKKTKGRNGKQAPNTFRFLGIDVPGTDKSKFIWSLAFLIAISIIAKIILILIADQIAFVDLFDIGYYAKYASQISAGGIPYITFQVDYPQFVFIPILAAMALSVVIGGFPLSFIILSFVADAVLIVMVYLAALKLTGSGGKAYTSAFLYATAFGSAYFVVTKYDVFPTLFMMTSLVLFIYGREIAGYVCAAVGTLTKWFPALAFPIYLIYDKKNGRSFSKGIIYSIILFAIVLIPFVIGNFSNFIFTYTANAGFPTALSHGFIYLVVYLTGLTFISTYSAFLMVIAVLAVIFWYYTHPNKDYTTMTIAITIALFFFILLNRAASPQHWLWIMPFFAIFLVDKIYEAAAFYIFNLCMFLDFPFFYTRWYDNVTGYFGNWTAVFFAIKFAVAFSILYIILRKIPKTDTK